MVPESLYSVSRSEYKGFVEQIKPECYYTETVELNDWATAIKIFSIKTHKCLCSRVSYKPFDDEEDARPETYYIFVIPDPDERCAPIPKRRIVLNTIEEVQTFFDLLSKINKEKNND